MLKLVYRHAKSVAALAATGILTLSALGTAFADESGQDSKGKQGVFGSVTAKGENSLTVTTKQGTIVDLAITPDTQFQVPGKEGDSFADVALGSRVAVLAAGETGAQSALKVMLVPGKPQREHRALTVTEVSGKTVVAEDAEGNRIEVELDHEASADIKGQLITFIGAKSAQSNRFKANVEVKIEHIVQRLEAQAKRLDVEAKGEADVSVKASKQKHRADLEARLEANMQRHLDLFAELIAKAPPQARASLEAALQATLQGYKAALEGLGESKSDVKARLELRTLRGSVEAISLSTSPGQPPTTPGTGSAPTTPGTGSAPATGSASAPTIGSGQATLVGEITVKSHGDAEVTLKLTSDTHVFVGKQPAKLSDISVGDRVNIHYNSDNLVAAKIQVQIEAKAHGRIEAVDSAGSLLTVVLPNGATLELKLTPNTRIEVNHKKAAAADLKANARVEVEYNTRTMDAFEIEASTKGEVKGTVKSVDAAAGTVIILTKDGKEVTLKITDATKVDIHGLLFGILGVSPGMYVKAEFDLTTGEAWELDANGGHRGEGKGIVSAAGKAKGTIASVDAASGKITLNLNNGGSLEVGTTGNTEIELNGRTVDLASLKVGTHAAVEYDTETMVASEVEAQAKVGLLEAALKTNTGSKVESKGEQPLVQAHGEVRGKVKKVNAFARQLVIETEDGKLVTVDIAIKAKIIKHGETITLLNIKADTEVKVQLQDSASGNVAATVEVQQ